jgi:hypothetical protein
MDYYVCIRESIQKFESLACKIAIEGGTLNLAMLSLSGVFFRYSFYLAAVIISFGSIFTTVSFGVMARFYSKMLGISVKTAKKIEDEIFPESWNSCEEMGKKFTQNLDDCKLFGTKLAGDQTWKVILLEFIVLFGLGLVLFSVSLGSLLTQ